MSDLSAQKAKDYADKYGFVSLLPSDSSFSDYDIRASGNGYQSSSIRLTRAQAASLLTQLKAALEEPEHE
jgi:hypothetical protein